MFPPINFLVFLIVITLSLAPGATAETLVEELHRDAIKKDSFENVSICNGNDERSKASRPCMCRLVREGEKPDVSANTITGSKVSCQNGNAKAGNRKYPCKNVDLLSYLPLSVLSRSYGRSDEEANDLWGWTNPTSRRDYAIIGVRSGTAFVDITDPVKPIYKGKLPYHNLVITRWADVKTYGNYAFIVNESYYQGMQIFDLTSLENNRKGSVLKETAHYDKFNNAHNMVINEESGFGYAVGSNTCEGGLHMIDIKKPLNPQFAGCFSSEGYTHDAQCVIYKGDDERYLGSEICFAMNNPSVSIIDVTNKAKPMLLSRNVYPRARYAHQGWLTEDHNYFIFGDEEDEKASGSRTTTFVYEVKNLRDATFAGRYVASTGATDHNLYVKGDFVYQANYRAGLRILRIDDLRRAAFTEVGYFDIYPMNDGASLNGAWTAYPFFESGVIIVSGIEQGLFVLRRRLNNACSRSRSASKCRRARKQCCTWVKIKDANNNRPFGCATKKKCQKKKKNDSGVRFRQKRLIPISAIAEEGE